MEVLVTGAGWSVGIIVLVLLFKPIFDNKEEFWECVSYWFTPDFFSFFKGEAGADFIAELKLGLWVALGIGAGIGTSAGVRYLLA